MKKLVVLGVLIMAATAFASEPSGDDLKKMYDSYNTAAQSGNLDSLLALRTAASKKAILAECKTPAQKKEVAAMLKAMVPFDYVVEHVERTGKGADMYIVARYKDPDPAAGGKIMRQELVVMFDMDAGKLKIGDFLYRSDPDALERSADKKFDPESSYDLGKNTSIGGRIASVEFAKDYTLVVLRITGEEDLVFLPPKEQLKSAGIDTAALVPWVLFEAEGHPHKQNKFKVLAKSASVKPLGLMRQSM
jgi:hypothetical protein